jgi:hypothetical protein
MRRDLSLIVVVGIFGCPAPEGGDGNETEGMTESATDTGEPDDWSELLAPLPGSRLRPLVRVADDGTQAHIGWYDTILSTECAFRQADDGVLRCLPPRGMLEPWRYADPDCTQPAAHPADFDEGATVTFVRDGCFDERYYEIGEVVTTELYYNQNGPCEVFSHDSGFRRLTTFAVAGFVAATITPAEGNSRIVPLVLEADDGTRAIAGAWDREHEEEVTPRPDTLDMMRWFGRWQPRVSTLYFADAACTEPVAIAECVPPATHPGTASESEPGQCGALYGRRAVTEETQAIYYRAPDSTECEPSGLSAAARTWRVGDALADDDFAAAPATNDGASRMGHDMHANPEGSPLLPSTSIYDMVLSGLVCDWIENPDVAGDLLCKPFGSAYLNNNYLDAECTQRTATRYPYGCYDGPPAYAFIVGLVVEVIDTIASPGNYAENGDGECVEDEWGDSDGGWWDSDGPSYFRVGDAVDVDIAHAMDVVD